MTPQIIRVVLTLILSASCIFAADLRTEAEFKSAYEMAIREKDFKKLEALVCWDGVSAQFKSMWHLQYDSHSSFILTKIELSAGASPDFPKEFTFEGVRYQSNLTITHTLIVKFRDPASASELTETVPVGQKDGKFWIVGTAPVFK